MRMGLGLGLTAAQSSGGSVDPDAAIAAILSDDSHIVLDMSYLANMWQDSAKAAQVSTAGQTIGAVDTKFGTAARTMQQAGATARPLWDASGFAVCDGTDDGLGANANAASIGASVNGLSGTVHFFPTAAAIMGLIGIGTATSNAARFVLQTLANGSITLQLRRLDADGLFSITSAAGVIIPNNYYIVTARVNYLTGACNIFVNGVSVASGTLPGTDGVNGTSATSSNRFRVWLNVASTPNYLQGYGGNLVIARRYLSDTDMATVETWCQKLISEGGAFRLGAGARTWFNSPVVLADGDMRYVSAAQDDVRTSRVLAWDIAAGTCKVAHVTSTTAGDDHDEGATIKLADGNFLRVGIGHNVATVYAATGTDMFDLTEFDISADLNRADMTYTNLWQATGLSGDPIYQFGRGGGATIPRPQCYSVSTDGGANWTEYQEWVWDEPNGHSPYCQFAGNAAGTQFHVIGTTTHPDLAPTGPVKNKIWHGYFDGTDFRKTDGTVAGTVPILPGDFTTVHDGSATGDNNGGWVWDLKWIGSDLVGVFASFPSTTAHRYHRCVLSGGTWSVETVVDDAGQYLYAAQPYYSGGICCHPTDKDILFAAIEDGGGIYQINRLNRVSAGVWTATPLTTGSVPSFRPDTSAGVLTFVRGVYTAYTDFPGCFIMGMTI